MSGGNFGSYGYQARPYGPNYGMNNYQTQGMGSNGNMGGNSPLAGLGRNVAPGNYGGSQYPGMSNMDGPGNMGGGNFAGGTPGFNFGGDQPQSNWAGGTPGFNFGGGGMAPADAGFNPMTGAPGQYSLTGRPSRMYPMAAQGMLGGNFRGY
jgi:hypothetical protein